MRTCLAAMVLLIGGCSKTDPGPKVIRADGVDYVACGGILTVRSPHEPKDIDPGTYQVMFEDPKGVKHGLSRVRSLSVTPLKSNPTACNGVAP
jgi:hypothetical protein